jgi:hypothetical protein
MASWVCKFAVELDLEVSRRGGEVGFDMYFCSQSGGSSWTVNLCANSTSSFLCNLPTEMALGVSKRTQEWSRDTF